MTEEPRATEWSYSINYGPDGEENYAFVYDEAHNLVGNLKTHHARAVVARMNEAALASISEPAQAEEGKEPVAWRDRVLSRLVYPVDTSINPRGWDLRETSMIEEAVRFLKEDVPAAPSSSTLEITEEAVEAALGALAASALGISREEAAAHVVAEKRTKPTDYATGMRGVRAALEASLPFLSQTGGWRAPEEHPAWNGREQPPDVLVCSELDGGFVAIGRVYRYEDGDIRIRAPGFHNYEFSHWQPLPTPPSRPSNEAGE